MLEEQELEEFAIRMCQPLTVSNQTVIVTKHKCLASDYCFISHILFIFICLQAYFFIAPNKFQSTFYGSSPNSSSWPLSSSVRLCNVAAIADGLFDKAR